jgi:ATP-binding cassette subfamily C protein CydCD
VAVLVLAERLFTAAAAWVLFDQPLSTKVGVMLALAAAFTAQNFASKVFAARTEAELTGRVIESLLAGDVLRSNVLSGEDARAELGQGIFTSAQSLAHGLPSLAADLVSAAVLSLVIAAFEPGRVVALAMAATLVAAAGLGWSRGRMQQAVVRAWDLQSRAFDAMVDALEGRLEIVASGRRAPFAAEAVERSRAWGQAGVRVAGSLVFSGRLPLLAVATFVGIVVGMDSRWRSSLSMPLADVALFASVTPAFAGVAQGLHGIVQAEQWLRIVAQVVQDARSRRDGTGHAPSLPTTITFEDVSFGYEGARDSVDVLQDVSFTWNVGHVLALSGANGSGKSTCLRLLLALAQAQRGVIRVGGVDLSDLDADAWRARIAFLPQRPYLPPRSSVRAAIRLIASDASDERIRQALDRVGLIDALSRGDAEPLDTPIDSLSVGQRQRVALARMLCRDASLILLDEPEANLDQAGISLVAGIVRELAKEHMVMVAAHTPELLELADRVIVLDAGRVARDEPGRLVSAS